MQGNFISYALLACLAIALLIAAFTDLRRREIDNWLNMGIALAAPLFWLAGDFSLVQAGFQIAMAFATLAVLLVLFVKGAMGGGDVKLLVALALWIEPAHFVTLLVVMSIAGGAVTMLTWGWHLASHREGRIDVPYGIAISAAGLWVLATHYID